MPFEGACAQGRLGADHRVREPGARQAGLCLLSGERVVGRTELGTGLDTSSPAPEPLCVQEVGSGGCGTPWLRVSPVSSRGC